MRTIEETIIGGCKATTIREKKDGVVHTQTVTTINDNVVINELIIHEFENDVELDPSWSYFDQNGKYISYERRSEISVDLFNEMLKLELL